MSLPLLPVSPTVANIDQNLLLTVNWTPPKVNGGYTLYSGWNIYLATPPNASPTSVFTTGLSFGGTVSSPSFEETLQVGDYAMSMVAVSSDLTQYQDSPFWDVYHTFPPALTSSLVAFDNSTLLLGQTLTITLSSLYDGSNSSSWQVFYQDGSSSGPLPLSNRVVTKIFTTPGTQTIVVQVLNDFSLNSPPVKLTRSFAFSVYVMNQQYSAAPETSITGTLGVAGEQGFEIVNNTSVLTAPQPFEVIVRSLVRDMITNELKLLVATSRYSNASSLLGTMALDVFPFSGRPQAQELLEPLTEVVPSTGTLSPVSIQTASLPSNSYVGIPMLDFKMAAAGGNAPYSWFADGLPPGLKMSIDGTISGTPTQLGNFTVNISVMDSTTPAFIAEGTFTFTIPTNLTITTTSIANATVLTPYTQQMVNTGGLLPFTWSIQGGALPVGLTINPATGLISGVPCTYSLTDFSNLFSVTIQVQDAVGALASSTFTLTLSRAALTVGNPDQSVIYAGQSFRIDVPVFGGVPPYTLNSPSDDLSLASFSLIDGVVEAQITVPNNKLGVHYLTIPVTDSATPSPATVVAKVYYTAQTEVSNILDTAAAFDHIWGYAETNPLTEAISGTFQGFVLNQNNNFPVPGGDFVNPNGLAVTVCPITSVSPQSPPVAGPLIEVSGPPTSYGNTEADVPIILTNGVNTVATIIRTFSLLSHNDIASLGDIGVVTNFARPYIIGDAVGLNPQRPYFNSPLLPAGSPPESTFTVRLKLGSALPTGLSLDQITGLVYGNLLATYAPATVFEYIDASSNVHGTITVNWNTVPKGNSLTSHLGTGKLTTSYTGTIVTSGSAPLVSATVYRGHLPAGLSFAVAGNTATLSGTPTEAGYFDLWIQLTDTSGSSSYLYQRLAIQYITPLTILTSTLQPIVETVAYSQTLIGYGGVPPYTWSSDILTSAAPLSPYITLNASTGVLSGTVPNTFPEPYSANVTFTLTDSNSIVTHRVITLTVNSALTITTTSIAPITAATPYTFQLQAIGGIAPYTWQPAAPLPTGITFNSSGVLSGTTTDIAYGSQSVTFTVQDSVANSTNNTLTVTVGVLSGMTIDSSGVVPINRGVNYLGTLAVQGSFTTLVSWTVIADPNNLFVGEGGPLTLTPSSSDSGTTARITGLYTGAPFASDSVTFQAVDLGGHLATAVVNMSAITNIAITSTSPLPQGLINIAYSQQLTATGGGSPTGGAPVYTWSSTGLPGGFSLSAGGLLTGTSPSAINTTFNATVSDGMSPADSVTAPLQLVISASTLAITNSSPLPGATAGVTYSNTFNASGGSAPYNSWTVVAGALPSGLTLNSSTGILSGKTTAPGTYTFTVQVTDNAGSTTQKQFSLTVAVGLTLKTGIDYVNGLSLGSLGYVANGNVDTINPRTNKSFYVVALGVIATQTSQLSATPPAGYTYVVESVSGGVAFIRLSGPFSSGSGSFPITVTDVGGVNASATFTYTVYTNGALRTTVTSGSIPSYGVPLLQGVSATLPIYNNPSSPEFDFQAYNSQTPDAATAATTDFTLSGDNNNYQGLISFGYTNPNFQLSYNGGTPVSGSAGNSMTLSDQDIAWYQGSNKSFDLFAVGGSGGGKQLGLNFLYFCKPTVSSVSPISVTIPPLNYTTNTGGPFLPHSEVEQTNVSGDVGWITYGNLGSGGQDTITLYSSNNSNAHIAKNLLLTNLGFNIPSNATVTNVDVSVYLTQSAGTSGAYTTINLLGWAASTINQTQEGANVVHDFSFYSPAGLTPAIVNSAGFGAILYLSCTQQPGTGAVLQLQSVNISVTYTVPNYNNFVVTLSQPISPQQQGGSGVASSIGVSSCSFTNGVSVIAVNPNYGTGALAGWLTGWTIQAQFPSGTGTISTVLSMTVNGNSTILNGTSIVSQPVTYISGNVATITGTYS
jgi:hypothetical protein